MLTDDEISKFRTFGFHVLRGYLKPDEVAQLRAEFKVAMGHAYTGNEFDGTNRHWIPMLGPAVPSFARLAGDARFLQAGCELSGTDDTVLFAVDANRYVGDTAWHSDWAPGPACVKFAFYLDPVRAESGALRVLPMSQWATPYLPDTGLSDELKDRVQQSVAACNATGDYRGLPAVALESEPGDVVVFNPLIFHSSVGGGPDRPMCTVVYFPLASSDGPATTQVTPGKAKTMQSFGATDISQVFDLQWFADQDWGAGHAQVIANLRRSGALSA